MLVGYPIEATEENWLQESLAEMIKTIHNKIDAGQVVPSWNVLIPATLDETQKNNLKRLNGIKDRLLVYKNSVETLLPMEREVILQALIEQNNVVGLLDNSSPVISLNASFPAVYIAVHDLFVFAYGKLTDLGIRDRQYKKIFESLEVNTCPFCGVERIMSPQETRQDQDHYLAKSIYPFAAANMRNLVPMCRCCNRDFKHQVDILKDINGNRRKAFDPYNAPCIDISLVKSLPFEGSKYGLPAWWIEFNPDVEETETWDQVFCIRTRYSRDVLNRGFNRWIQSFMDRCKAKTYPSNLTDNQVLDILRSHYHDTVIEKPVGLDFLKPKVFEMFVHHFETGNDRVIQFIRNAALGIQVPA